MLPFTLPEKNPEPIHATHQLVKKYFPTIIDEYSRIPFAMPRKGIEVHNIIIPFAQFLLYLNYPVIYIMTSEAELKNWLKSKNIPPSRTTPYNPRGNDQFERYNGTIWKAITLACRLQGLEVKH